MAEPITETEMQANRPFSYHKKIIAHPDGEPWDKCCRGIKTEADIKSDNWGPVAETYNTCQCAMRRPPDGSQPRLSRFLHDPIWQQMVAESGRFFCIHRQTEDGYHRECAGWYALYGRKRHEKA